MSEYGPARANQTAEPLTGLVRSGPWEPDDEQRQLRATVRAVLERHAPPPPLVGDEPGGYDAELWRRLAGEVGVAGLAVPEKLGGAGGSYVDCHLVLAELGRAVAATPYLATLIATQALLLADPSDPLVAWFTEGVRTAALVPGLRSRPDADDGWRVSGVAELVPDGARADVLLAVTDDGLFHLETEPGGRGLDREAATPMDRSLHLATVRCDDVPAERLGPLDARARERLADLGPIAVTAAQVGAAERCLELTTSYVSQRVQFGRPIGSFQAVKHRLADLLVLVDTATSASWAAAAAWAADAPDTPLLADVAASWCAAAYRAVAAETVQLHGGIAITWEHDAHRHLKHAHATAHLFGTPESHRARLATHLTAGARPSTASRGPRT